MPDAYWTSDGSAWWRVPCGPSVDQRWVIFFLHLLHARAQGGHLSAVRNAEQRKRFSELSHSSAVVSKPWDFEFSGFLWLCVRSQDSVKTFKGLGDNLSGWFAVWSSCYLSPSLWRKCFTQSPTTCVDRGLNYNSMTNQSNLAPADTHQDKSVRNEHLKINSNKSGFVVVIGAFFCTSPSYTQNLYRPINLRFIILLVFSKIKQLCSQFIPIYWSH